MMDSEIDMNPAFTVLLFLGRPGLSKYYMIFGSELETSGSLTKISMPKTTSELPYKNICGKIQASVNSFFFSIYFY